MSIQRAITIIFIALIAGFLAGGLVVSLLLPSIGTDQTVIVVVFLVFLLFGFGFALSPLVRTYLGGPARLVEDINVIINSNAEHRVQAEGLLNIKPLAQAINQMAERLQMLQESHAVQLEKEQARLAAEKKKLAALVSELTTGVVVCNREGRILLYNAVAKQLLDHREGGGFMGLGRSIFGLIEPHAINTALNYLAGSTEAFRLVLVANNGQFIQARIISLETELDWAGGFLLFLADPTAQAEANYRQYWFMDGLMRKTRSVVTNIRAAIEIIQTFSPLEPAKRVQLENVIYGETLEMGDFLMAAAADPAAEVNPLHWRMEEILGSDLLLAAKHDLEEQHKVTATVEIPQEAVWLKVDGYAIVLVLSHIMYRLKAEFGIKDAGLRLSSSGQLAAIDLSWPAGQADIQTVWSWQYAEEESHLARMPVSIALVAAAHGGELWCQSDEAKGVDYFRLLLPATRSRTLSAPPKATGPGPVSVEFYDFDLFRSSEETEKLGDRLLADLIFTVFDTETTGLEPAKGDELISISAVRIVNGRLLRTEVFDRLIDPKRPLPAIASRLTGITAEMLTNQPTVELVMPEFFEFARDSVLVAHNAAFDMRFLALHENRTGLKFSQPVLDTLLLSEVVQPHQTDHSLEAIGERLGIPISGRHSSMGDAFVTGQILLKFIPLLAEQGIVTLAAARAAAQETYLARVKY